ncbi:glycine--tRNA ligase subunit beta [Candidatus Riesia pediculicola]|uniref:Glycine--tRNA ligase beta subunit n=1 Tax=Riesia pediculicola (strain USDA) TaxID=515618 RepID=D4G8Z9_RIEPU|nr:glycine--tRNA ligase subunit beta [Candidatus Riesia pediculicola]ADD79538.1 glycyl-tRNA synthetase, beta subunit [Candidatus Riesia pediculicola USDA]QOJ86632.1 glycine--tRNA ligase subunit beta [Candidatus Riesia pediculicola]
MHDKKILFKKTLLIEIGTEDLPYRILWLILKKFSNNFLDQLKKNRFDSDKIYSYVSLRRLAVKIIGFSSSIEHCKPEKRLIKTRDFPQNNFSKCYKKKCFEENYDCLDEISFHRKTLYSKIIRMVIFSLRNLSSFGFMKWGDGNVKNQFIRPVHSVVILLDKFLVNDGNRIFGINISRKTLKNRSYFSEEKYILLDSADQYPYSLQKFGHVIPDYKVRKSIIRKKINILAKSSNGTVKLDYGILDQMTSMVEWPNLLKASFKKRFLSFPKDIIVHIVQTVHKYIPIYDKKGQLTSEFIFVYDAPFLRRKNKVIHDNQKVINSRLEDILFFFQKDRIYSLFDFLSMTKRILFYKKLGNMYEKTKRIIILSKYISEKIGITQKKLVFRASLLSKCDLATSMVNCFSDTQGIVGMCYAKLDMENDEVSIAIREQYYPRYSRDRLPISKIGDILSISDKIDSLVAMFGIGIEYQGKKDPLFLRRMSIGILRIMIEKKYDFNLLEIIEKSSKIYSSFLFRKRDFLKNIDNFLMRRLKYWYFQNGCPMNLINSIQLSSIKDLQDFNLKIKAILLFQSNEKLQNLFRINKRISKIVNKNTNQVHDDIDHQLLQSTQEIELFQTFLSVKREVYSLFSRKMYFECMLKMHDLVIPVDHFFKHTIIMDKNHNIRQNRINILKSVQSLLSKIIDFSCLKK